MIVSLGGNLSPKVFQPLPGNTYLFPWVPQLEVLMETDCSINHAGKNTINECLHFAVPMLIYSGKSFDQNGNAARMVYHGLGVAGNKDQDTSEEIRQGIAQILGTSSYKNKMLEYRHLYRSYHQKKLTPHLGL